MVPVEVLRYDQALDECLWTEVELAVRIRRWPLHVVERVETVDRTVLRTDVVIGCEEARFGRIEIDTVFRVGTVARMRYERPGLLSERRVNAEVVGVADLELPERRDVVQPRHVDALALQ